MPSRSAGLSSVTRRFESETQRLGQETRGLRDRRCHAANSDNRSRSSPALDHPFRPRESLAVRRPPRTIRTVQKLSAEGRVRFESMWQNVLRKHGDRLTDDRRRACARSSQQRRHARIGLRRAGEQRRHTGDAAPADDRGPRSGVPPTAWRHRPESPLIVVGEDVLYLSIRELGELLRTRKLSPVELTDSYLERSERLGPRLNAYATLTPELARRQAASPSEES